MIAVTGVTGFIGSAIMSALVTAGEQVVALTREPISDTSSSSVKVRSLGDLREKISPKILSECRVVIHAAARAHVMQERESDPLKTFLQINTDGTLDLAEAAFTAGVRRFIFISSIGVLGNRSCGKSLTPSDSPAPVEDYAISKARAEIALDEFARRTSMEVVVIRPPLVHGPGAKGNFLRLLEAIWNGNLLPLGGATLNRRSFVGVKNIADALLTAAAAPFTSTNYNHINQPIENVRSQAGVYHIADDGVISTRRLVEVLAEGMGVKPRLLSIPRWLAVSGATMLGKGAMARRLFDDLEVDDSDFRRDFHWQPKINLEDGLRVMAEDFARRRRDGAAPGLG
jgi:nucleoside-diphosphate-sugar epimerase